MRRCSVGAPYAAAWVALNASDSLLAGLAAGGLFGAATGGLLGLVLGRLSGVAFSIGSLAFGGMVAQVANSWAEVTGGSDGLVGLPFPRLLDRDLDDRALYGVSAGLAVATYLVLRTALRHRPGLLLHAVRDNPVRAASSGLNVHAVRIATLAASRPARGPGGRGVGLPRWIGGTFLAGLVGLRDGPRHVGAGRGQHRGRPIAGRRGLRTIRAGVEPSPAELPPGAGPWLSSPWCCLHPAGWGRGVAPEPATSLADAPVLEAIGLSKRFGGKQALRDVSMRLARGTIAGLIGPNGAGKSTVIGVLAGTVAPDRGHVSLCGITLGRAGQRQRARNGLGRTFQTPQVFDSLTLRQHIVLGAPDGGWGFEACAHLGLDRLLDQAVATFSHGLRRLAEICHVAAQRPRVLLLDEPAAGLTAVEMGQLDAALRWLRPRVAMCLVEHNMGFLLGIADGVTVLDHGQVIATGTPDAIVADPAVREAYLGSSFARH